MHLSPITVTTSSSTDEPDIITTPVTASTISIGSEISGQESFLAATKPPEHSEAKHSSARWAK